MTRFIASSASVVMLCAGIATALAGDPSPTVTLDLPVRAFHPVNQPLDSFGDMPGLVVNVRQGNATREVFLPAVQDTYLNSAKQGDAAGTGWFISLIRQRGLVGLLKFDLAAVPADAVIEEARLRLTLNLAAGVVIRFHSVLTEWDETATWSRPTGKAAKEWKGLQAGADYVAEPVAVLSADTARVVRDFDAKGNRVIDLPGFTGLARAWHSGATPNQGLLLELDGPVRQVFIASREDRAGRVKASAQVVCDGAIGAGAIIELDLELLRHCLPPTTELLDARLTLKTAGHLAPAATDGLALFVMPGRPVAMPLPGRDYVQEPVARFRDGGTGTIVAEGLGKAVSDGLKTSSSALCLFAGCTGTSTFALRGVTPRDKPLTVTFPTAAKTELFECPITPAAGVYVRNENGNLYYGGRRLRLWGAVVPQRPNCEMPARMRKMGFNAIRLWGPRSKIYEEPNATGNWRTAAKDDGSDIDQYDRFFAAAKEQGMFVMATGLMGVPPIDENSQWLQAAGEGRGTGKIG